jgi:membrane protein DedA with SNARE-associated domain
MLAVFVSVPSGIGYLGVFLLVAGETAGALVPGETALIVAGALAARGDLSLAAVIAVGAAGAIAGDNIGFVIGQRGIRRLLTTGGSPLAEATRVACP